MLMELKPYNTINNIKNKYLPYPGVTPGYGWHRSSGAGEIQSVGVQTHLDERYSPTI